MLFGFPSLGGPAERRGMPFRGGSSCWIDAERVGHTPVAVLESLVVVQTVAAEPWRAPVARVQTMCLELGLHRSDPVLLGRWWEGPGLVLFADGAHDGPFWRIGGFSEFLGVRSLVGRRMKVHRQQLVELQSDWRWAWGIPRHSRE